MISKAFPCASALSAMMVVATLVSGCNKHKILRAEMLVLQQKLAEEEQTLRQTQAQLHSLGNLGTYNRASTVELAAAKAAVERLVKDKETIQSQLETETAKLQELKSRLEKYQSEQFRDKTR